ncbi:unnamed protein product [Schistocephalus solidus]|uniref:Reverse transcriptase domain-containing protein n=1 Tax=Schistocephalus solidus TaxID=70667 RepID=A0A183TI52_SCHSO|nr:unnamed protein product [Schistocephalus solidus]
MDSCLILKRQDIKPIVPVIASSSDLCLGTRIFDSISNIFGREALESARRWEIFALRVSSTYAQIEFLHRSLDIRVLPKSLSYKPPVNTTLAKECVMQHGRRMTRALIQGCQLRLQKYCRILSQIIPKFLELIGENGVSLLDRVINNQARELRSRRDMELRVKFQKLSPNTQDHDKTLVHNLSSKELTPVEFPVLQHEASFNTADADPVNLAATSESVLKHSQEADDTKHLIRQQLTSLLLKHKPRVAFPRMEQDALRTLNADRSIVILPADKGRSAVVLDKSEYLRKANALLDDRHGLPKVHKHGAQLRPIISLRGSPKFNLAKWLFQRQNCLTSDSDTTVRSAAHFLERLRGLHLKADEVMVSFDVTSLFTSIPPSLAIETGGDLLENRYDEVINKPKRVHLIQLLTFCLKTFFTFEGTVYEQMKGTPMGSPLSVFIAEAVLQNSDDLLKKELARDNHKASSLMEKQWHGNSTVYCFRSDRQTIESVWPLHRPKAGVIPARSTITS